MIIDNWLIALYSQNLPESLLHGKLGLQARETFLQYLPPSPPADPALSHTHTCPRQYLQKTRLLQVSHQKVNQAKPEKKE